MITVDVCENQTYALLKWTILGIDIGKLERILQIGAPYSCSSFVQRLGRSGRRTGISEMYFSSYEETNDTGDPFDSIPWPLIQMIAVIQLYIEERWVEPIVAKSLPYSLLYQQTMSMLASTGELSAKALARKTLSLPPFKNISQDDYKSLLLHWISMEHLQWTGEHTLIIGLRGEPIVNHFTFYAIFPDEDSYKVVHDGRELGNVDSLPPEGTAFALAGRFWNAVDVDPQQKTIFVKPAKRSSANLWRSGGGDVHTRIVRKMRDILMSDLEYPYMFDRAVQRLYEARAFARKSGILHSQLLSFGTGKFNFVPWVGTCGMRTLNAIFNHPTAKDALSLQSARQDNPYAFTINSQIPIADFIGALNELIKMDLELAGGLQAKSVQFIDKYDYLLPPDLLVKQYANNQLGIGELLEIEI